MTARNDSPQVAAPLADGLTRRLSIRRLTRDDLDGLAVIFTDIEVWRFEYGRGMTRIETGAFLTRQLKLWSDYTFGGCGVRELERSELVGVIELAVPATVASASPARDGGMAVPRVKSGERGYAAEAATAVLDQAFTTMGLDRVGCVTNAENLRSVALAQRLGMRFVTEVPVQREDGNGVVAAAVFHVSRDDWLAAHGDQRNPCVNGER